MSGNGLMTIGELSRRTGTPVKAGASMLLAAARGYAGCEVLAVPNWRLRRDDQVGCVLFAPVDAIERGRRDSRSPAARGYRLTAREAALSRSPDGGS